MFRFNGYDKRLERTLEAALLIMEAFEGFEHKFVYSFVGHSGDSPKIPLLEYGKPPANRKERLKVLQTIYAHTQYCQSGDHTLESVEQGMKDVVEEDADQHMLILVSDANLRRYGIDAADLSAAFRQDHNVDSFAIFIGGLGDEAETIAKQMPPGHAFNCKDTSQLPHLFRQIFTSNLFANL